MSKVSPTIKAIQSEMAHSGVGITELADRTGIAFSTLYRNLNGDTIPNLDTVEAVLKALKMKLVVKKK